MPVNTKQAERRELLYTSIDDLRSDLDRLDAAHAAGTLRTTGNWSAGQAMEHCSILAECAIEGFPSSPPALVRWLCIVLLKKKALRGGSPPAGFKIPKQAAFLEPGEGTTYEEGAARLRRVFDRVTTGGERFRQDSPVFGKLSHDEWVRLQLGHSSLHMSFVHPE